MIKTGYTKFVQIFETGRSRRGRAHRERLSHACVYEHADLSYKES